MEWIYSIISVFIVSLVSLVGVVTISIRKESLEKFLIYFVSFSAGALFGDAFIHLIPEAYAAGIGSVKIAIFILLGIIFLFIVEKFLHWRHCHGHGKGHIHPFAYMNLVGDGVHNFIDGLIIASSYLVDIHVGIATTIAVIMHEIPQELGDFGVLLRGGFSKGKALFFNLLSSTTAILGAVVALFLNNYIDGLLLFLIPFAAGHFIYIAGSDLIPELHKEVGAKKSAIQLLFFIGGIGIMLLLLLLD